LIPFFSLGGLNLFFSFLALALVKVRHSTQQDLCKSDDQAAVHLSGPPSCSQSAQCMSLSTHSLANIHAFAGLISGGEKWLTQARYFLAAILFTESIHKGFTNLKEDL